MQSLPAATFGVAPVEDRSYIPLAATRFSSDKVFSMPDAARTHVQACLVVLIPSWKLSPMTEAMFVQYVLDNKSELAGSSGIGYRGTKIAALHAIGPRAFYRSIVNGVFNDLPWLSATCSKDEMRVIVDGEVKKPRAFVASNLHDFAIGVILFYVFAEDLLPNRGWKSVIGINPFTEWNTLFQDLRSEQVSLGLPDKWSCVDISGSDKFQKHGMREVFTVLMRADSVFAALLTAYLANLHGRYHVDQNGFVFFVEDGLDSGKWVTLLFNTLYSIVAILWILYDKGVSVVHCVRWPFRVGGDDAVLAWPFEDETFYEAWSRLITPVTDQTVTNENGFEGDPNPPATVPLLQTQLYSMSFFYDVKSDKVYPKTTRPNKALARLQVCTSKEIRKDLVMQLILVHYWHRELRALLETELLDNKLCTNAELQLWLLKCLVNYDVPRPECKPFRRAVGYKKLTTRVVSMSTTTTVTKSAGPKAKTVTTVVKKKPMKTVAQPKKAQPASRPAKVLPQDAWFKACLDPEHNKAVPLPDNFGGLTTTFKQKLQISVPAPPVGNDIVVIVNQNPEAGLWIKSVEAPEVESALKIKPSLAAHRHEFLKNGGYAQLMEDGHLQPEHVRKMALAAKLRWTTWVYGSGSKTKALLGFTVGTQAHLHLGPVETSGASVDSYFQALGKQTTGFLPINVDGQLSATSVEVKPTVVDEFGQPVELEVSPTQKYGLGTIPGNHVFSCLSDRAGKFYVELVDDTGVVRATNNISTIASGGTSFSLILVSAFTGNLYPRFRSDSTNWNLKSVDWQAPIPDNNDDWYQIPTPDSQTILDVTNGLRCTAQDLLCTFEGSTLLNQGAGVISILPADFFQTHTVDDVTYKTLAELPMEYDGRASEGLHAFMPPFGAAQSIFQQSDSNPYDDQIIAAPRIAMVLKGLEPGGIFRFKMNWHGEGPSTSQLFANRPRGGDPAAMAFCTQALSNMNPCSANFIHLMIVSACLTAWRVAVNIAPTLEAVCKFGTCFAQAYKTAFSSSKKPKKSEEEK